MDDLPVTTGVTIDLRHVPAIHDLPLRVMVHDVEREYGKVATGLHLRVHDFVAGDLDLAFERGEVGGESIMAVDSLLHPGIEVRSVLSIDLEVSARMAFAPAVERTAFLRQYLLQYGVGRGC